jgi:hypothetical protein
VGEISIGLSLISNIASQQVLAGADIVTDLLFRDNATVQQAKVVLKYAGMAIAISSLSIALLRSSLFRRFLARWKGTSTGGGTPPVATTTNTLEVVPDQSGTFLYPRGQGASQGPLPSGYTEVSRWVDEAEMKLWLENQGTFIPAEIGGGRIYVTLPGAPKPGGTGSIRIDFAVADSALQGAGNVLWRQIFGPVANMPIYNVRIVVPN